MVVVLAACATKETSSSPQGLTPIGASNSGGAAGIGGGGAGNVFVVGTGGIVGAGGTTVFGGTGGAPPVKPTYARTCIERRLSVRDGGASDASARDASAAVPTVRD